MYPFGFLPFVCDPNRMTRELARAYEQVRGVKLLPSPFGPPRILRVAPELASCVD